MNPPKCRLCQQEHWQREGCPKFYGPGKMQPNAQRFGKGVRVQACRPGDRAILATPAGAALVRAAVKMLKAEPKPKKKKRGKRGHRRH